LKNTKVFTRDHFTTNAAEQHDPLRDLKFLLRKDFSELHSFNKGVKWLFASRMNPAGNI
jgi:hypothetical protein